MACPRVDITRAPVTEVATCCLGTPREISTRRWGTPAEKDARGIRIQWPAIPDWCPLPTDIPFEAEIPFLPPHNEQPVRRNPA